MAKLTMGTDSALALQRTIQTELARRGYSSETDPVMAEYITIMVINDKTPDQINNELADLIGPDYESNFTDWLFTETAKAAAPATSSPSPGQQPSSNREDALPEGPGVSLIQNALSGVHPPSAPSANRSNASLPPSTAQKRTFSARSPSPSSSSQPPKARRTDAPIGPRAMMDRDRGTLLDRPLQTGSGIQNSRSLLDRVGPHNRRGNHHNGLSPAQVSHIQAKIDGITGNAGPRHRGPMPPMNGGPAMNPLAMQEMLAMQMNLMAQMAANMGMINNGAPGVGGFPQQNPVGFPQQHQPQPHNGGVIGPGNAGSAFPQHRGRGGLARGGQGQGRGGGMGGTGRGRGGSPNQFGLPAQPQQQQPQQHSSPTAAPAAPSPSAPERPGTPSLCKYALKCTNPQCRFSHPSPVATVESGVVLSTEFCPKGRDCQDKHCTLGHVSPSVVNGSAQKPAQTRTPAPTPSPATSAGTPCKFGLACTRHGCMFTHPPNFRPPHAHHHPSHHQHPTTTVPCRFGASCTRGDCPFQHPKGHVSANMFYRGLGPDAPLVEGYVSPHRSVRFGTNAEIKAGPKDKEQQETEKKDEKEVEAVALGNDKVGEKKTVDVGA